MFEQPTGQPEKTVARFGKRWWAVVVFGLAATLVAAVVVVQWVFAVGPLPPPLPPGGTW